MDRFGSPQNTLQDLQSYTDIWPGTQTRDIWPGTQSGDIRSGIKSRIS